MSTGDDVTADLGYWCNKLHHSLAIREQGRKMMRTYNPGLRQDLIVAGIIHSEDRVERALRSLGGLAAEW